MNVCREYATTLMKKIAEEDGFRDITLVAGIDERRFPVHRNVMAASGEYFRDLFKANPENKELTIKDIGGSMLKLIIGFCYSGRIALTEENVDDIMAAASTFKLTTLEKKCNQFWEMNFSDSNLVFTLLRADKFDLEDLRKETLKKICNDFENIPVAELNQLGEHIFREMLSSGRIAVSEVIIFDRLIQWVNENEIDRAEYVAGLLKCIKLKRIPFQYFHDSVDPFCAKYGCTELLLHEYRRRSTVKLADSFEAMPPALQTIGTSIGCVFQLQSGILEIRRFYLTLRKWLKIGTITLSEFSQCVFHDGYLFIFQRKNNEISAISSVNLNSQRIETIRNMPSEALDSKAIAIGNHLYLFERIDLGTDQRITCQRFSLETYSKTKCEIWETRSAPPSTSINIHSAIEISGQVLFTTLAHCLVKTEKMVCYDTFNDKWSEIAGIQLYPDEPTENRIWDTTMFKSKNHLYATVSDIPSGFVLYEYNWILDAWTKVENIGICKIDQTIEFDGGTYAFTSNKEFGSIFPEKSATLAFFTKLCEISDWAVPDLLFLGQNLNKINEFSVEL